MSILKIYECILTTFLNSSGCSDVFIYTFYYLIMFYTVNYNNIREGIYLAMNIILNACVFEVFKETIPKNILALILISMDTYRLSINVLSAQVYMLGYWHQTNLHCLITMHQLLSKCSYVYIMLRIMHVRRESESARKC